MKLLVTSIYFYTKSFSFDKQWIFLSSPSVKILSVDITLLYIFVASLLQKSFWTNHKNSFDKFNSHEN